MYTLRFSRRYKDGSYVAISSEEHATAHPGWDVEYRRANATVRFRHRVYAESREDAQRQVDGLIDALPVSPWTADPEPELPTPIVIPDVRLIHRPSSDSPAGSRDARPLLKPLPVRRTVLAVDDAPLVLSVVQGILSHENLDLLVAPSGPDALKQLASHTHGLDMLIVDYEMPEMKGLEVTDRIRTRYPRLRVLFLTGYVDRLFQGRPELGEGQAFLEKPFSSRGLREAVRLLLFGTLNPVEASG